MRCSNIVTIKHKSDGSLPRPSKKTLLAHVGFVPGAEGSETGECPSHFSTVANFVTRSSDFSEPLSNLVFFSKSYIFETSYILVTTLATFCTSLSSKSSTYTK